MKMVWKLAGGLALLIGIIGIFLPLLPTTPLILLAAFCFSKGSDRMHDWILHHRIFGPMIEDWNKNGAINSGAKKLATLSIVTVLAVSVIFGFHPMIIGIQAVTLACVLVFIWTRPSS